MNTEAKHDAKVRLARMAGQLTSIGRMLEDDRYCVDILTQVAALRAALEHFGAIMLTQHIEECVYGDGKPNRCLTELTSAERIEEVRTALSRFLR